MPWFLFPYVPNAFGETDGARGLSRAPHRCNGRNPNKANPARGQSLIFPYPSSIIGRKLNRKMANQSVERLFIGLMAVIICISLFNTWRYAGWWTRAGLWNAGAALHMVTVSAVPRNFLVCLDSGTGFKVRAEDIAYLQSSDMEHRTQPALF